MTHQKRLFRILLLAISLTLGLASSASALTLGVGWSGDPSANNPEMPIVASSGAAVFRVPLGGSFGSQSGADSVVAAAAESGVTIHAEVSSGASSLPVGLNRTDFINWVHHAVERYGYSGQFWDENPSLPYRPIGTWEIGNEPNLNGIDPIQYGQYLSEVADSAQAASESRAGRRTEVLFAGIFAWGNKNAYEGARKYLSDAYPSFGSNANVTGVAIHPYEQDPSSFYKPPEKPQYNRIQAFEFAVAGFRSKLVELAKGGSPKSLWVTEVGWPGGGPEYSVGPGEQGNLLRQAFTYARNNASALDLKGIVWYNFRDRPGTSKWDDYCGLRAHDGSFRPAWTAFQEQAGAPQVVPQAPAATTQAATEVFSGQAILNGSVNPHGLSTSYTFQWGLTGSYGRTTPATGAGNGEGVKSVGEGLFGLAPNTTYHYRVVATNALGTTVGSDQTLTTQTSVVFADGASSSTITSWGYGRDGWDQTPFYGDEMAKGTRPSALLIEGLPHVFFVDASKGNTISDWHWSPGSGWQLTPLNGDKVAAGTSPSAAMLNGTPHVFFVDATKGNTLTAWNWTPSLSWTQLSLGGDEVAAGTSPSAAMLNGTPHAFFVDATKGNTLAAWNWTPSLSWSLLALGGDKVAAGTSPSAAMLNGTPHAFFVDATKGNTLTAWNWTPSLSWNQLRLGGDEVAAGTSPSAVMVGEKPHVFFVDASKGSTLAAWNWTPSLSWNLLALWGDKIAAGTSPSAVSVEGLPHVFFVDATKGNTITDWNWNPSASWHQTPLLGHPVAAGTSPAGWPSG